MMRIAKQQQAFVFSFLTFNGVRGSFKKVRGEIRNLLFLLRSRKYLTIHKLVTFTVAFRLSWRLEFILHQTSLWIFGQVIFFCSTVLQMTF